MLLWMLGLAVAAPTGVVERVVLHPDAVTITRTVQAELAAGDNQVLLAELPGELDPGTLRVGAPGGVSVAGIDVRTVQHTEDRREAVAALDLRLEALADSIASVDDGLASITAETSFWDALRAQGASQLSAELLYVDSAPGSARALASLLAERLPVLTDERRALERQRRELERQRRAVQAERDTLADDPRWTTYEVSLRLTAEAARTVPVALHYTSPEAGWQPRYTARGDGQGPLSLELGALVSQTTGEDWTGVALAVSTAASTSPLAPTDPPPFWLGDDGSLPAPEPCRVGAHTFEVGTVDLAGDGRTQRVELARTEVAVTWLDVVVPRQQAAAFRVAQGAPWTGPFPLLPGLVDAWWGEEFTGIGTLSDEGASWEVGFGVDPQVSVDFRLVDQRESGPSFGRLRADRSWEVALRSAVPVLVEVRDQLPVSSHRKVVVRRTGAEPSFEQAGRTHWRLPVPPGGAARVQWGVSVRRPASWAPGEGT